MFVIRVKIILNQNFKVPLTPAEPYSYTISDVASTLDVPRIVYNST